MKKRKKLRGEFLGTFFSFEGGTMVFLYVQFYILHSYMCILTNFRTLLLLNGRDKIMMKRNNNNNDKKTNIYLLQKFREIVWFFVVVKIEGVYIYIIILCVCFGADL